MPGRFPKPCTHPGCGVLVVGKARCLKHEAEQAKAYQAKADANRASSSRRGYGRDWQRCRRAYLAQHPLCEIQAKCHGAPATEVDHITPIHAGGARLDFANLQAACKPCHSWKTAREDGAFGRAAP